MIVRHVAWKHVRADTLRYIDSWKDGAFEFAAG